MFEFLQKLRNGERVFIICVGDSITEQNETTNGKLNYVGLLGQKLMQVFGSKAFILNTGIGGDTSAGILGRLNRDVIRFSPDLVTLMVGMNDPVFGDGSVDNFKSNVKEIINKVQSAGTEILLLTQNPLNFEISDNSLKRAKYPEYASALHSIAREEQIPLCDIYNEWVRNTGDNLKLGLHLMDDHVHPNQYGHELISKILFDYLEI